MNKDTPRTQTVHPWARLEKPMTEKPNDLPHYTGCDCDWCAIHPEPAKEEALCPSDATACSGWVGRLSHDRSKHADWGWLRDEAGELIVIVKVPFMEDEELHEHRRKGTDPAQGRVNAILSALYGQNRCKQPTLTNYEI